MHQPPKSYFSPTTKIGQSRIEGLGLLVVEPIAKDEIVGIKDGYIVGKDAFEKIGGWFSPVGKAMLQIENEFFLGPTQESEIKLSMMHVNHSCNPTTGFLGNCIVVAMRDLKPGDECTADYATWLSERSFQLVCKCGEKECRHNITANDWQNRELQNKYKGYFSGYIQKKIDNIKNEK